MAPTGRPLGSFPLTNPATKVPTNLDIAWAAGIYEGEGSCQLHGNLGTQITITQKDKWLLDQLQELFGGRVKRHSNHVERWYCSGPRARGFLLTIFPWLSPRRKHQVLDAIPTMNKQKEIA